MRMNSLKPAEGSKSDRKRVGRGIGTGNGKTAGRGHKGQKSRSGGYHKVGFEGGQMPLQRRLPKRGFRSRMAGRVAEIRLHELESMGVDIIDLTALQDAGIVNKATLSAKVIDSGALTKAVTLKGIRATQGARKKIESAGGKLEE